MAVVTVYETRTGLSRLIAKVIPGGKVVIARGVAVRLVPCRASAGFAHCAAKNRERRSVRRIATRCRTDSRARRMNLLLDTHAMIWWRAVTARSALKRARVEDEYNQASLSAASATKIDAKYQFVRPPPGTSNPQSILGEN